MPTAQRLGLIPSRRTIMSELSGVRVAVLATDGFEESELTEPVKALREAGAHVTILSPKTAEIQGVRHDIDKTIKVNVDHTLQEVRAEEFDAVHLPGGLAMSPQPSRRHRAA
jgi:protease I